MPPMNNVLVTGGSVQSDGFSHWMERNYRSRRATAKA
jgi:hypothetical protein